MTDDTAAAAAAGETTTKEIVFRPRGPATTGGFEDPNLVLAKMPNHWTRTKHDDINYIIEPKGAYINARAKRDSDRHEMVLIGPLLMVWPTMYPYGHTRQHYPEQGGVEMRKYAAKTLEDARYKATQWSRAWDPHLADADGNDIHAVQWWDSARAQGDRFREIGWANEASRKHTVEVYQNLARIELKKKLDAINDKYAKWATLNKQNQEKAKEIALPADDLKFRKMTEAERAIFLPTEEDVRLAYFDRPVHIGFKQSINEKTGLLQFAINYSGSVFRPMTGPMRKMLEKTAVHHTREILALFNSTGTPDDSGKIRAALGWAHNDVPLVILSNKKIVPFSQRRAVLGNNSVCAFEYSYDLTPCNKNGDCCMTLVPRTIYLFRQAAVVRDDPTAQLANIVVPGAEDIVIPDDSPEEAAAKPDEKKLPPPAAPPVAAPPVVAAPPPARAANERVLRIAIEAPPLPRKRPAMPAATVEEMHDEDDDDDTAAAMNPTRAALDALAAAAEPTSPEVTRSSVQSPMRKKPKTLAGKGAKPASH